MDRSPAFEIDLPGYEFRSLHEADLGALQRLFELCADYVQVVEGVEVSPTAAQETIQEGPPGRSLEDKLLFGLFDARGQMLAFLDGFRHYPDPDTWWIGLLMLAPSVRGQGIGRKLVDGFERYVSAQGGRALMLGVVEENLDALRFWQSIGFTLHSTSEPRPFGQKMQVVYVLRRACEVCKSG